MSRNSFNVGRFPDKVLYSVLIAIILFIGSQFLLLYREFASLDDQKMLLQSEVHAKDRRLDEHQRLLMNKERELHRLEMRLNDLDKKIKLPNVAQQVNSPEIYFVTPTYARPTQKADLTRLSQTLMHIPNLYWIVIEDNDSTSVMVSELLKRTKLSYAHLFALTPPEHKLNQTNQNWLKPRGVLQRNAGLGWIRTNLAMQANGVVYFGDDDNTYDLRLFDQMRYIERVGVWPVGLVGGLMVERPLVNNSNQVYGWVTGWKRERPFPIDMAGFAINLKLIQSDRMVEFSYDVQRGYQESLLLNGLGVTMDQMEPKADKCTKVYVWHTRTEKPKLSTEKKLRAKGIKSNDRIEV